MPAADVAVALANYSIEPTSWRLLTRTENDVHQVDDRAGAAYILRIHRPGRRAERIRSELDWLAALRHDTDLLVPDPVPTRDGDLLTRLPDGRCAVLFRRLDGEPVEQPLTPDFFRELGVTCARLQAHGAAFDGGPGFDRSHLDAATFGAELLTSVRPGPWFSVSDVEVLTRATALVSQTFADLVGAPDAVGLAHADLHDNNCLRVDGRLAVLDFDDCCVAPYAYDLAVPVVMAEERPAPLASALRAALLDGYRSVRPLPPGDLNACCAARRLLLVCWLVGHRHDAQLNAWAATFVPAAVRALRTFVDSRRQRA